MDLSFTRWQAAAGTPDGAALLAGVVARQAASPTARAQARLADSGRLTDAFAWLRAGAFEQRTGAALAGWSGSEGAVYPAVLGDVQAAGAMPPANEERGETPIEDRS